MAPGLEKQPGEKKKQKKKKKWLFHLVRFHGQTNFQVDWTPNRTLSDFRSSLFHIPSSTFFFFETWIRHEKKKKKSLILL